MPRIHFSIVILGILIDQYTKILANKTLSFFLPKVIIPKLLSFHLVHNYGAAYGILQGQRTFLLTVSVLVIFICVVFSRVIATSRWSKLGLSFLLIGAVGNFLDRAFLGYVIDFVDIKIFPVFNIADICIDIGIGFFVLEFILSYVKPKSNPKR
ncbi:signal peptidase II [Candidatus Marinamargulisbacteria bacterium SCGC AAA071-K20]|nr:signal peptidase II [Candidatus Marinamargulisbacteria bacterium SCGC AAA071-K20]